MTEDKYATNEITVKSNTADGAVFMYRLQNHPAVREALAKLAKEYLVNYTNQITQAFGDNLQLNSKDLHDRCQAFWGNSYPTAHKRIVSANLRYTRKSKETIFFRPEPVNEGEQILEHYRPI
jgi:hypothetical protein